MKVIHFKKELQTYLSTLRGDKKTKKVALVPTMGYLHAGHELLFSQAKEFGTSAVSIFVNPFQFNDPKDYQNYPRDRGHDLEICEKHNVDIVFIPSREEMFPKESLLQLSMPSLTNMLCGQDRCGHFEGVLRIVLSLFHLFQPAYGLFGKKDYQQYLIIRRMVTELDLPIRIIGVDTFREESGLAYSSRNARLSPEGRQNASLIYRALKIGQMAYNEKKADLTEMKEIVKDVILSAPSNSISYIELVNKETLQSIESDSSVSTDLVEPMQSFLLAVAVFCEGVRLIDNIEWDPF